ncbi:MAG: alpha/beta hydrolase [Pseudomonadota bacterium]
MVETQYFQGPRGRLAYVKTAGAEPTIVWLGGFRSDMTGTKAMRLESDAAAAGRAYLRFDYSGHGASDGAFDDGCIGDWADDAAAIVDALGGDRGILVGSSMGAWIAALLAPRLGARLAGVVFIAPAPDFTTLLMEPGFSAAERAALARDGRIERASPHDDAPTIITARLIEDGRARRVLDKPLAIDAPVRILQGSADDDVPVAHAMRLFEALSGDDVAMTIVKGGDHRLSEPRDLDRLSACALSVGV